MPVQNLGEHNSILNQYVAEIRDEKTQKDSLRFRRNLERIGWIMGYEISKSLEYKSTDVATPLGRKSMQVPNASPYLVCILRAAVPFFQGMLDVFDRSQGGFIGAYRAHTEGYEFEIDLNYMASDQLTGKTVIIVDPMLATGKSVIGAIEQLKPLGNPARLILASIISAQQGIDQLQQRFSDGLTLYTASIDAELDERYYIIPGLGDAGDLAFGKKTSETHAQRK